jgi:DNA repair protein RadA
VNNLVKKPKETEEEKPTDEKQPSDHEADVTVKTGKGIQKLTDISGIGPKTAEKLKDLGYSLMGIATGRAEEISAEMKVSFVVAKGWVFAAQEALLARMSMKTANEFDKEKKAKQQFFKTGSPGLNGLLGGGVPTMSTTGVSGRFSTGKTQMGYDLIVDCLTRIKRKAVFIETEPDTFHLDRLKQLCRLKKINEPDWDNLTVCGSDQIPTAKAQFLQYKVVQKALEGGSDIGLVVCDSFTAKFRPGYSRREMLPVRTREFTEHFLLIDFLAARYNVAWFLTCQVIGCVDPVQTGLSQMKTGDGYYPVGGEFLLHSVNNWISLKQIKTELYAATLYDSSWLPRGNTTFMITTSGLQDEVK